MDPINQALLNTQNAFLAMADRKRQARLDEQMQQQNALAMALQQAQLEEFQQKRQIEDATRNAFRQRSQFFDGGKPNFPMARPGMDADSFTLDALMNAGNYGLARQIETENEARGDKNLSYLLQAAQLAKPTHLTAGNDVYQMPGDPTFLNLLASRGVTMPGQQGQTPGLSLPSMAGFGVGQDLGMPQGMPQGAPTAAPKKVVSGPRVPTKSQDFGGYVREYFPDGTYQDTRKTAAPRQPGTGHGGGKPRYVQYTGPNGESRMVNVNDDGERKEAEATGWQPGATKMSGGMQENLATTRELRQALEGIDSLYSADYVGKAQGTMGKAKEWAGFISEQEQDFRINTESLFNIIGKLRSGAAWTAGEIARLRAELPKPTDSDITFERKVKALRTQLERKEQELLNAGNRRMSQPKTGATGEWTPAPAKPAAPVSGNRQQMGRPKTANAYLTKWK